MSEFGSLTLNVWNIMVLTTLLCGDGFQDPDPQLRDEELVFRSRNNVLIETLIAGRMGLPSVAGPTYQVPSQGKVVFSSLYRV